MRKPSNRKLRRCIGVGGAAFAIGIGGTATAGPASDQDNSSCLTASGMGYVCNSVTHDGSYVRYVWATRAKTAPPEICQPSVWVHYIPPWGGAYGLGYDSRGDCIWFTGIRAYIPINRWVPSGSRVCVAFNESGGRVGSEPCVTVR